MAVYGIVMMRDEEDVAEGVLRHMAAEVDQLLVADHGSSDTTPAILAGLAEELPLTVIPEPEPGYYQARKMASLAALAATMDHDDWTVIVPFDADELWYCPAGRLRDVLPGLPWNVFRAPLHNHLRTSLDVADEDPFRSMVWRQMAPGALPKVAYRWQPGAAPHQGNHGVDLPDPTRGGYGAVLAEPVLQVRHFPIRSSQHMVRKAENGGRAYAAAPDLPEDWGRHWRAWYQMLQDHGRSALHAAYQAHWYYPSPIDAGLTRDPAPYRRWEAGAEPTPEAP